MHAGGQTARAYGSQVQTDRLFGVRLGPTDSAPERKGYSKKKGKKIHSRSGRRPEKIKNLS